MRLWHARMGEELQGQHTLQWARSSDLMSMFFVVLFFKRSVSSLKES